MIRNNASKWLCLPLVLLAAIAAPAQTFTTLFSFDGSEGFNPYVESLAQGPAGNLYGATSGGGDNFNCQPQEQDCGTIFRLGKNGQVTTLHIFDGTDGDNPSTGLILASDRNFYGVTQNGGDLACQPPYGCGTVFRITPDGRFTTVHVFEFTDGLGPHGALVQGTDGDLYGTTCCGGPERPTGEAGTIFKISLQGTFTLLHAFCPDPSGCADGNSPHGALIQGTDGNFYGTTYYGGDLTGCLYVDSNGCGTVFRITPTGKFSVLHRFHSADGEYPEAGLVEASDGSLYGTTSAGGAHGDGTVFKIAATGEFTSLHIFDGVDGGAPTVPLIQGTDGNLYGTTTIAAHLGYGSIFKITPAGSLTTLYTFCSQPNCTDGAYLPSGLLQDTDGKLYGMTAGGGTNDDGTIFRLNTGLGPFVKLAKNAGRVGTAEAILGQGFTGTTGVSFNGIPAAFTVKLDTLLVATVPPGATSGYATVTTPRGVLTSNRQFIVLP